MALQTAIANQIHSAGKPAALAAEVSYLSGMPLEAITEVAEMTQESAQSAEAERLSAMGESYQCRGRLGGQAGECAIGVTLCRRHPCHSSV